MASDSRWISILALTLSLFSAAFTGGLLWEARLAREDARAAAKQNEKLTQDAMRLQAEQAQTATHNAERSAQAAEQSAAIAKRSLYVTEGAFVDVAAALAKPLLDNEKIRLDVTAKNAGRTSAYEVMGRAALVVGPISEDEAYRRTPMSFLPSASHAFLSPGAEVHQIVESPDPMPRDTAAEIRASRAAMFVFGSLVYKDAFGRRHSTEYCFKYSPAHESMDICTGHNSAR